MFCGLNVIVLISISFNRSFFYMPIFRYSKLITRMLLSCSNLQTHRNFIFHTISFSLIILSFFCGRSSHKIVFWLMFCNKLDESRLYYRNIMANGGKYNEKCVKNETIHVYLYFIFYHDMSAEQMYK